MSLRLLPALSLGILAAGSLAAQEPPPLEPFLPGNDVPVRRALPVNPPGGRPAPIPVAPAEPETGEAPAPKPVRKPIPKATPLPEPVMADPGGEIRVAPGNAGMTADRLQLSIADSFYARGAFETAAPEYEKYLGLYPNGADKQTVLFRLGESYRRRGNFNAARSSYQALLDQFASGEFIGPAAYRLAEIYFDDKNYAAALPYYRKASVRLQDQKLANAAKFFVGRCHENLGQKRDARIVYEDLVAAPENNPFIDNSRLSYAVLLRDEGRVPQALKQIDALKQLTENPELKAQATVYSGLWSIDAGDNKKGEKELEAALEMQESARWRDMALLGLMQIAFNKGDYEKVVKKWNEGSGEFSAETRPQVMIMAAKAYRAMKKEAEAAELFDEIATKYSGSVYAREASYERLVNLYRAGDPGLLDAIEAYLSNSPDEQKRDQVMLMKAESLFKQEQYAAAAPIYEALSISRRLTGLMKAEALRKLAWCHLESQDHERAVKTYTELIDGFPTFDGIPAALLQRAVALMRMNNMDGAIKDFRQLIERYPKSKERELALQQYARLLGQQGDNTAMVDAFKVYLRENPNARGPEAAEANYWIGSVAFQNKDYKDAVEPLRKALEGNPEEYFEQISQRLMASLYYLEDKDGCAREVDAYLAGEAKGQAPYDVLSWLGLGYHREGAEAANAGNPDEALRKHREAQKYLGMLVSRGDAKPADLRAFGTSALAVQDFGNAGEAYRKMIATVEDPRPKAEGFNGLAQALIGQQQFPEAQKAVDAGMALQPEGTVNAALRTSGGDILAAQQKWVEAAKLYESVTLLVDDESVTPGAGEKAVAAYRKAGQEDVADKLLNRLQSRYPEYFQEKKARAGAGE